MIIIYDAEINDDDLTSGVYGISLVEDPAMESNFVALSKSRRNIHKIKFSSVKGEERVVCGVVMIPNKLIYRNDEKGEYYLRFSKETIKKSAHLLLQKGLHYNSTIEHERPIDQISIVESWIVDNPNKDKANHYGLEVIEGCWCVKMKINNDYVWENFIKTGVVKGFSIDGLFEFKESKSNTNLNLSKMKKKGSFLSLLAKIAKGRVAMTRVQSDDNPDLMFDFEGDEIELGVTLYVVIEADEEADEVKEIAPQGVYYLEGKEVEVDEDGIVIRIGNEEEEITEEEAVELMQNHFEKPLKAENARLKIQVATLKAQVKKLGGRDFQNPRRKASLKSTTSAKGAVAMLRAKRK